MPSNPLSAAAAAAAAAAVLLAHPASAFPWYIPFNPNALAVKGVAAIGHINPAGGGERNPYGLAFAANAHVRRDARARARARERAQGRAGARGRAPRLPTLRLTRKRASARARARARAWARASSPPYLRARR